MTEIVSAIDVELDDLNDVDEAESREEGCQDAFEAAPAHSINQEAESSTSRSNPPEPPEGILDSGAADLKAKLSSTASTATGTWVGGALGIGTLIVAIYYGYWSLSLQRWSALKDFKSQCQEAEKSNTSTPECVAALALPLTPPPVMKRFAQKLYDCVTFRPGCSDTPEGELSLSGRSISKHKKPWWLLLLQTLGLLISISILHWLQSIPPNRLRAGVHHYLGERGMLFLRYVGTITWETCLLLSCFSPLYAVWFWWMYRKRMKFSSVVALTYIGGAFSVYYVYGSRMAGNAQRKVAEKSWRVDLQSVEQQIWTRPDGVCITRLHSGTSSDNGVGSATALEFRSGRVRRHR